MPDNTNLDDHAAVTALEGLAARLATLDVDAATLELIMAAVTADVCDQVDTTEA